jgi:RNase P subunit RPR2
MLEVDIVNESDFKVCFHLIFHKRFIYSTSIVKFNTPLALYSNKDSSIQSNKVLYVLLTCERCMYFRVFESINFRP